MWIGFALMSATVGAQPLPPLEDFQIRSFTAADGLIGADVRGLVQGSDRFIYVFNARGLVRFDGHRFRPVPLPGFRSRFVTAIKVDQAGRLWVRTAESQIGFFERGVFHVLPPAPVPFTSWSETQDGVLWLGGTSGLVRVDVRAAQPYTIYTRANGLPSLSVAGVFDLPNGERVAVAANQLARFVEPTAAGARGRFEAFGVRFTGANEQDHDVRVDTWGLWFTAKDSATSQPHLMNYSAGVVVRYGRMPGDVTTDVDSMGWANAGSPPVRLPVALYLTVRGGSALRELDSLRLAQAFRTRQGSMWYVFSDFNDNKPRLARRRGTGLELVDLRSRLVFTRLRDIIEDHEGSLWIGTDRGLLQLTARRLFALTVRNGLAEDFTSPILQTRNGDLWIGTYGGGLQRFSGGKPHQTYTTRDGLPFNQIRALHEARDGRLWVGTSLGYAIIRDNRVVRTVPTPRETRSFAEDDSGVMWVGTETMLLRDVNDQATVVDRTFWQDRGIWALHRARDGAIWIGSERGLFRMRGDSVQTFGAAQGLRSPFVASIAEESDGTLWFGTYDHGLHRYRGERLAAVTTEHGLYNNGVWRMIPDEFGGMWMSSDQGIFRVSRAELHTVADAVERGRPPMRRLFPTVFAESEGMPNRESNRGSPAGWRLTDGRLVFNNLAGAVIVDPRVVAQPVPAPRTVVHDVSADGAVLESPTIQVSSATRQLAFEYSALSFLAPEQNHFRYRVDGYDRDWVDAGTGRRATYTNLPPGSFTFRVQGATGTGAWSDLEGEVPFTVHPVLWQTWWFRLLLLMLALSVLAVAYRVRVERLLELERLRLRIASDLHDDVGSSLSSIALLSDMLKDVKQFDAREQRQVRRINAAAEETIGALRDIIWLMDPQHDELADLVVRMKVIAADMLASHSWTFTVPESTKLSLDMVTMRNLLMVYKEALHNILKHAAAQTVAIQMDVHRDGLLLQISDNGRGFDVASSSQGHGIASMRRRAAHVSGTLALDSTVGAGTRITLTIPIS